MKVLITGANGFIGRHLVEGLCEEHSVTALTRKDLQLTDRKGVDKYFSKNIFDVVVHCAFIGSDAKEESTDWTHENILMVYNLLANKDKFRYLISFGSGAELRNDSFPIYPYALSKNVIARLLEPLPYAYNLRVFGCFASDEPEKRFFRSNIKRNLNNFPIEIYQNKRFSTIFVDDLVEVVMYYIYNLNKKDLPKTLDCCYRMQYDLLDFAEKINQYSNLQSEIKVADPSHGEDYLGDGKALEDLKIPFKGLDQGIQETIRKIANEY